MVWVVQSKHSHLSIGMCFGLARINARCRPKLLYHSPSSTGERKCDERLVDRDKHRERSLTNYRHRENRLNFRRKGSLIHHQSNQRRIVRNKIRSSNTFPPSLPSSQAQIHSCFSTSSPPQVAQGDREWGLRVSPSHVVCAAPSSSGGGLLTLFLCSSVRSLSQETVLHKPLQRESFPRAAALHELPQGPSHRVQYFRNRLLQRGSPTGSQALPANLLQRGLLSPQVRRSWQEPAPAQAPHGNTVSFRHPPAAAWGPFHGLQVEI